MVLNIKMEKNKQDRIGKLDGLRGILSLIVCLNHSFMVIIIPTFASVWQQNPLIFFDLKSKLQQLLMLIGNGGVAVTLFFVLSGLVLGQSLSKIKFNFRGILAFWAKRIIRLYPVYLFVVILTAIYMKLGFVYQTFPHSSTWFNWWMNFEMTLKEFILNISFIHIYVGGVTWTLRVILLTSFFFPLIFLLNKKVGKWVDLLIVALLIYLCFTIFNIDGFRDLRYLYMFYLGLSIPKFAGFFSRFPNRLVILISLPVLIFLFGFRYLTEEYQGGVIEAIISFFIIGLAAYGHQLTSLNFLETKILKFFGKISYSLYLIHFSVLYIMAKTMFIYFPGLPYENQYFLIHLILFIFSTIIATGISVLVYHFVEEPAKILAQKTGDKILQE